jgi:hypothetical protein
MIHRVNLSVVIKLTVRVSVVGCGVSVMVVVTIVGFPQTVLVGKVLWDLSQPLRCPRTYRPGWIEAFHN